MKLKVALISQNTGMHAIEIAFKIDIYFGYKFIALSRSSTGVGECASGESCEAIFNIASTRRVIKFAQRRVIAKCSLLDPKRVNEPTGVPSFIIDTPPRDGCVLVDV